jgi:hypothetical protein
MGDLTWASVRRGKWLQAEIDWQQVLEARKRIDPYLIWADLTLADYKVDQEQRKKKKQSPRPLGFIIEFAHEKIGAQASMGARLVRSHGFAQDIPLSIGSYLVEPSAVKVLVDSVGPSVKGFELSAPRIFEGDDLDIKSRDFFKTSFQALSQSSAFFLSAFRFEPTEKLIPQPPPSGAYPLICVVDDGCNFASSALGTRVDSIWDQDDSERVKTRRAQATREWSPGSIAINDKEVSRGGDGVALTGWSRKLWRPGDPAGSEDLKYRQAAYKHPVHRWSHGGAVLDVLGARSIRLDPPEAQKGCQRWHESPPQHLRFVQLPNETVLDTSGASLAGHALDAVLHALQQAVYGQDVIVNLSYGTHGGPHDGSSMFERALEELLIYFDGDTVKHRKCEGKTLHVVLPAGNSHLSRSHATKCLAPEECVTWYLKVLPDDPTDNHVEIWTSAGDRVAINVRPPGQSVGEEICAGQAKSWGDSSGAVAAMIFPESVPQGHSGSMALLAIGPTRRGSVTEPDSSVRRPAPHGVWQITVRNLKTSSGTPEQCATVHAWIQRGDLAPGRGRDRNGSTGRQPYFLDLPGGGAAPESTLNGIACLEHARLFVVGAMRASDRSLTAYSAAGPNRNSVVRIGGPDLVTVADESLNMPGLLLRGTSASSRIRVSGTSIAAPLVARMLYEHLAAGNRADTFKGLWSCLSPSQDVLRTHSDPHRAHVVHRGDCVRLEPTERETWALVRARRPQGKVNTPIPAPGPPPPPPPPRLPEVGEGDPER